MSGQSRASFTASMDAVLPWSPHAVAEGAGRSAEQAPERDGHAREQGRFQPDGLVRDTIVWQQQVVGVGEFRRGMRALHLVPWSTDCTIVTAHKVAGDHATHVVVIGG